MMAQDRDIRFIEAITDADGAHKAWELFSRTFGDEPSGVWAAPGRVNLIGEHTDYNAGLCLPIALPHRIFIALAPRQDTQIRAVSAVRPDSVAEAELEGLMPGEWQDGLPIRQVWHGLCVNMAWLSEVLMRHSYHASRWGQG